MPPAPRPGRIEHPNARPRLGAIIFEPALDPGKRRRCLLASHPDRPIPDHRRRRLPERASLDCLLKARHPPLTVQRHPNRNFAPACCRAKHRRVPHLGERPLPRD